MIFLLRLLRLSFGLLLYAIGIIFAINANIGYSPWDSFHIGLSKTLGLSLGTVSILVGGILCLYVFLRKETIGLGMLLNMVLIGLFMDLIIVFRFIPILSNFWLGLGMLFLGLIIIAFATYFYISAGFGAGPRDALMVLLTRCYGISAGTSRALIEASVLAMGYFLGAKLGFGTVFYVILIGPVIQVVFKLLGFNPKEVAHETLRETFYQLFRRNNLH